MCADTRAGTPQVTICVLTFGDFPRLARQALESISRYCPRNEYRLVVGANAVDPQTHAFLVACHESGMVDHLIVSPNNLGKSAMMRLMFDKVETEFIWWFDDDSFITQAGTFARWLEVARSSPASTVLWGRVAMCEHPFIFSDAPDAASVDFVRSASWYRGLPPPSWRPGGKGEFNLMGRGLGDGRWYFVSGGCFMIRTSAVRAMDWPDPRLFVVAEDIILGEAVRQQGWNFADVLGVAINTEPSRGIRK